MYFILQENKEAKQVQMPEWAEWMDKAEKIPAGQEGSRIVKATMIQGVCVSTVFIGLDTDLLKRPPRLFETMIFGGEHDYRSWKYSTWEEAEKGHQKACELVVGIE